MPIITTASCIKTNISPPNTAQPDTSSPTASLDPDMLEELDRQLQKELDNITKLYTRYVSCIRESLQEKGVPPKDLYSNLRTVRAFNHTEKKHTLVSVHDEQLAKAGDLYDIFYILTSYYASFLDYDIFQFILEKYHKIIDPDQEELKYPDHLKAYLAKHKVSEFVDINPFLKNFKGVSAELTLKLNIDSTCELTKLKTLKTAIANILNMSSNALRLLDIKQGCIVVRFLIPAPVAELVFTKNFVFTEKQEEQFQALAVEWLECNDCTFSFSTKDLENISEHGGKVVEM